MQPMCAIVALAGVVSLAACERPPSAEATARTTIATLRAAPPAAELLEQRVTVAHQTRVSRLCLDDGARKMLANFVRAHQRAGGDRRMAAHLTVESSWKGPCPAGLSPGQMIDPNGRRFAIADLLGAPERRRLRG